MTCTNLPRLVRIMIDEIRQDYRDGIIPSEVISFEELHDFVDANEYGSTIHDVVLDVCPLDVALDMLNNAQEVVGSWLDGGGLVESVLLDEETIGYDEHGPFYVWGGTDRREVEILRPWFPQAESYEGVGARVDVGGLIFLLTEEDCEVGWIVGVYRLDDFEVVAEPIRDYERSVTLSGAVDIVLRLVKELVR